MKNMIIYFLNKNIENKFFLLILVFQNFSRSRYVLFVCDREYTHESSFLRTKLELPRYITTSILINHSKRDNGTLRTPRTHSCFLSHFSLYFSKIIVKLMLFSKTKLYTTKEA